MTDFRNHRICIVGCSVLAWMRTNIQVCVGVSILFLTPFAAPSKLGVPFLAVNHAHATSACRAVELDNRRVFAWFDPEPVHADRLRIPLPLKFDDRKFSGALVFTRIGLREPGLFPIKGATFLQGADYPEPFESALRSRIASPIRERNGRSLLYLGTYEVSRGQYALVMGDGDLKLGLKHLFETSGDPHLEPLADFLDEQHPCFGKMTRKLHGFLRLPISFLQMDEYRRFISRLNRLCGQHKPCADQLASLSQQRDAVAYFRLPLEHEWGFAARGAYSYVRGELTSADLQSPVPVTASGNGLKDYAHLDNKPPRVLPIGSKELWHGFHDMIGNVQELMANPFTSETGSGAVGGALARGGSFRTAISDFRISRRTELTPYRRDEGTGTYFAQSFPLTGIRLAIGVPLTSSIRQSTLEAEFARSFIAVDDIGDVAGDSVATARDLGIVLPGKVNVNDELGAGDQTDLYSLVLDAFGPLEFAVIARGKAVATLLDESGNEITRLSVRSNGQATTTTDPLYPNQRYFLKIEARSPKASSFSYSMNLMHRAIDDTGVESSDRQALRYATAIRNRVTEVSGFVGFTDGKDVYPLRMTTKKGGLRVQVNGHRIDLKLIYRNASGKALEEHIIKSNDSGSNKLVFPMASGGSAFLEIRPARRRGSTQYQLLMQPVSISNPIFAPKQETAGTAKQGTKYKGVVDVDRRRLFVGLEIPRTAELQAVLSQLSSEATLTIIDANGRPLPGQTSQSGLRDRIFQRVLPKGKYYARVSQDIAGRGSTRFAFSFQLENKLESDLSQRDLALSKMIRIDDRKSDFRLSIDANRSQLFLQYIALESGHLFIKMNTDPGKEVDLILEDAHGSVLAKSGTIGSLESLVHPLVRGKEYRIIARRPGNLKDRMSFDLSLIKIPSRFHSFVNLMRRQRVQIVDLSEDWWIYRRRSRCGAATPVTSGVGKESLYVEVDSGGNTFWHGMNSAPGSSYGYTVLLRTGGIWSEIRPLMEGNFRYLLTAKDGERRFSNKIGEKVIKANKIRFQKNSDVLEFSLRGYRNALKQANVLCEARASYLWQP